MTEHIDRYSYLAPVLDELEKQWPSNKTINIVCHGHSVPSGYFATPFVNAFNSYPHLLHKILKERFPFAVINVIITAVGGEHSEDGLMRFNAQALNHTPSVITIDYALNDRFIGLERANHAWSTMIEQALASGVKVILLTPSWDNSCFTHNEMWDALVAHAEQIRKLALQYKVGLADSFEKYKSYTEQNGLPEDLLSHVNHPSKLGHEIIAKEIAKYFCAR